MILVNHMLGALLNPMPIEIIYKKISQTELKEKAKENFGDFIKGAIDIEKEVIVLGGELHFDGLEFLIENSSSGKNIWGFNIYPFLPKDKRIEFISLINIRPLDNNRSMEIQDIVLKNKISTIINKFIE